MGIRPRTALAVGLKVDVDASPRVVQGLQDGTINLDDPAVTLALLKLNSVRIPNKAREAALGLAPWLPLLLLQGDVSSG